MPGSRHLSETELEILQYTVGMELHTLNSISFTVDRDGVFNSEIDGWFSILFFRLREYHGRAMQEGWWTYVENSHEDVDDAWDVPKPIIALGDHPRSPIAPVLPDPIPEDFVMPHFPVSSDIEFGRGNEIVAVEVYEMMWGEGVTSDSAIKFVCASGREYALGVETSILRRVQFALFPETVSLLLEDMVLRVRLTAN